MERTGRCFCGQVTYRIHADPLTARVCWCRDCQYMAGNGTVNATFPTEAIEVSGPLTEYASRADSGNEIRRRFCPTCGSHLFANATVRPHLTVVRLGTLDDPASIRPVMNIWAASAPSWACLDDSLQRVDGQPQPPALPKA